MTKTISVLMLCACGSTPKPNTTVKTETTATTAPSVAFKKSLDHYVFPTFSPIYEKGEISTTPSFHHCKDVDVRIIHERIIKTGNLRVTMVYPEHGSSRMKLTMDQGEHKDVVRLSDDYEAGNGTFRFRTENGWDEIGIFLWPGVPGGKSPNDRDMLYIGIMRTVDGVKCSEVWHGEARRS